MHVAHRYIRFGRKNKGNFPDDYEEVFEFTAESTVVGASSSLNTPAALAPAEVDMISGFVDEGWYGGLPKTVRNCTARLGDGLLSVCCVVRGAPRCRRD